MKQIKKRFEIYKLSHFPETDLHNLIKKGNILKDIHKVYIMYQLFKAIKYIHLGNVIHRDLKVGAVTIEIFIFCGQVVETDFLSLPIFY